MDLSRKNIAIIGQGYVGLPLALEFGKKYKTFGFDINSNRIDELKSGLDRTREATNDQIREATFLNFTANLKDIAHCNIFIVTVPTPIDSFKTPDLGPLKSASQMLGGVLKENDVVIYESTVYPGCTEEICVPILEKFSNLQFNLDFFCGYSPERIVPGDKSNTLTNIIKVTSGSDEKTAILVDELYKSIITAGTHKAPSIMVAEASKAIENAQRDLNISFVNELALIFDKLNIDTQDVLDAAGTKWNFLKFKPGLVGGHCISVDPYYLAHKAENLGYYPEVILSGRRVNDNMGLFVANKMLKSLINTGITIKNLDLLVVGITFKENCPDIRNSKVVDVINELKEFGINVKVYDPLANKQEVLEEFGIELLDQLVDYTFEAIILAVPHNEVLSKEFVLKLKRHNEAIVFDLKGAYPREIVTFRL